MNIILNSFTGNNPDMNSLNSTATPSTNTFRKYFVKLLVGVLFVLGGVGAGAQTTLIDPTTDGGFESGFGTFTVVNGVAGNMWFTGTAAGAAVGTKAAFVGSNATTYTDGTAQSGSAVTNFFYKDITFPAGQTNITLNFSYKQPTLDGTFDYLKVFLVPTSTTPVAGTILSSGQIGIEYPGIATPAFTGQTITLPSSAAGTTQRLVFEWHNDVASPYGSGAIDNISLTSAFPVNYTSAGSGNWSSSATWSPVGIPTAADNVTIADGHTVTIDATAIAACNNLTVGQGTSGTLIFNAATARTINIGGNLNIAAGGSFLSAATGTVTTHSTVVAGNIVNNGTLNFSTNTNTAGSGLTFSTAGNVTYTGTGTNNLFNLVMAKSVLADLVDINVSNFQVRSLSVNAVGALLATASGVGTLKFSGTNTFSGTLWSVAGYTQPSTMGVWLNNPNFTVNGQAGSPTMSGLLRMTSGTYNVGTAAGNAMGGAGTSSFIIEGGTMNFASRLNVGSSGASFNMSAGTINVTTVGNASSATAGFGFTSATSVFTMSGGTINLVQRSTGATILDYAVGTTAPTITGGTLNVGTAATATNFNFGISGATPNLVIDNTTNPKTASLVAAASAYGTTTITSGATLNCNGFLFLERGATFTNNGTLTGTVAGSRLGFFSATPQTFAGTGVVTSPLAAISFQNLAGVTITHTNSIVTLNPVLFQGTVVNSSKLTLGTGAALAVTTQIGAAALATPGGNFDVAPVFNLGTGAYTVSYQQESVPRTTGLEIPATNTAATFTINNTNGVNLNTPITLTTSLALTAGLVNTTPTNILTLGIAVTPPAGVAASYVNGPLAIQVNSAANVSKTFAIGKSGAFRPVALAAFHSNGTLQTYTAEAINGNSGGTGSGFNMTTARYYQIQNTTNIFSTTTATVSLSYGADDNIGAVATAVVGQSPTAAGTYTSRGQSSNTASTIVSGTAINQGNQFFIIGNTASLPVTWDGGAGTSNWGDALNWSNDLVPTGATDVTLNLGAATPITVNGNFAVNNLTLGTNVTLSLGANTLTLNGSFSQSAGIIDLGSGTLDVKGATFARSGGTFTPGTSTVSFTGVGAQAITNGTNFNNLSLSGSAKTFTTGQTYAVANNLNLASSATIQLSSATTMTVNVGGSLVYDGTGASANLGSLTLNMTNIVGSTISSTTSSLVTPNITIATTGIYSLGSNFEMSTGRTLTVTGRLNLGTSTLAGAGNLTVTGASQNNTQGVLGTANTSAAGFNNVTLAGTISYNTGGSGVAIIDYNALGNQTINIANHPANTFIMCSGTGTKTLNNNYTFTVNSNSGSPVTAAPKGALTVNPGATFADGGFTITFPNSTTPYNNVIVAGSYLSSPGGKLLWPAGFGSGLLVADGVTLGDIELQFSSNSNSIFAIGGGTVNFSVRNMKFSSTGTGSTWVLNAGGTTNLTVTGDVIFNATDAGGFTGTFATTGTVHVKGNIISASTSATQPIMGSTGTNTLILDGTSPQAVTLGASASIFGGSMLQINNNSGVTFGDGTTKTFTIGSSGILEMKSGTLTPTGTTTLGYASGSTLRYSGTAAQTTGAEYLASMPAGVTVNINNSSTGVGLNADRTVNGTLAFTQGNLNTGAFKQIMSSTGTVTGASQITGWVNGNLQKNVATGASIVRIFEVGTNNYAPSAVNFASVGTAGNMIASTTNGDHPSISTSVLNPAKSVNRFWTLTNSGIGFTTAATSFTWPASDNDAITAASLKVGKFDAPTTWTTPAVSGTPTATTISTTNSITSFSDFAIAQACVAPDVPTINSTNSSFCLGGSTTLSIATGNLNDATDWHWYSVSCGGTVEGTGTSITVSPTVTTTYYVRGEGGCTTNNTCASVTITVNQPPVVSAGNYGPVCSNNGPVALTGSPAGGTFSGTGVTGNSFDPTAGTQTITYNYTDGNSCTNSATTQIVVNTAPTVSAGTYGPVCSNNGPVTLNGGSPAGGTYSGTGVTGNSFDPSGGTQTITYNYTDANGCSNSATTVINVNTAPTVSAGTYGPVCSNAGAVALSGTPAGGTFSGTGVTGNSFDPTAGTQTITYNYTDGNGCSGSATTSITVYPAPSITAGSNSPVTTGNPINLTSTTTSGTGPFGYSWTGPNGFTANTANATIPSATLAANGNYTVTVTDSHNCTASATTAVTVNQPVNASCQMQVFVTAPAFNGSINCGLSYDPGPIAAPVITHSGTCFTDANTDFVYNFQYQRRVAPGVYTDVFTGSGVTSVPGYDPPAETTTAGAPPKLVTYRLIVNDVLNGLTSTAGNFQFTLVAPLVLSTTVTPLTCPGSNNGAIDLTVGGGINNTYSWTGPGGFTATTEDISNLAPGTYNVTVTSGNGCGSASTSAVISSNPTGTVHNINTGLNYCSIQSAINAPQTLNGHVITVDAGTYREDINLTKRLSIRGANYGVNPNIGTRVAESIIEPATTNPDPYVSTNLLIDPAGSGSKIDGFTFDGNNPTISSGVTVNGVDVDAGEAVGAFDVVSNDTISNNIIKNNAYAGVEIGNYGNPAATTGNLVTNNKFDNIDRLDVTPPGATSLGIGVLTQWNAYTAITNNVMTRTYTGIQNATFFSADPAGAGSTSLTLSNNTIAAKRRGIWHNLIAGTASTFTINANTITAAPGATNLDGILIASVNNSVSVNVTNNNVTGARAGVNLWSNPTTNSVTVTGGTLTTCKVGVFANNYDGYGPSNAASSSYIVNGVTLANCDTAIWVRDNAANSNNATVAVNITNNTSFTGTGLGLLIEGGDASANFSGATPATFAVTMPKYIRYITNGNNAPTGNIDATSVVFGSSTGATKTDAQLFTVEDKIDHKIDWNAVGFVLVKANNDYVTVNSFYTPNTTTAKIQRGVDASSNGFTVNVGPGAFTDNVNVNKSVDVKGQGQANTTVYSATSNPTGGTYGALVFEIAADNVTIDSLTIEGNNPALTGVTVGGSDVDASAGIVSYLNTNLDVHNVTVQNVYRRGIQFFNDAVSPAPVFTAHNNIVTNVQGDLTGAVGIFNYGYTGSIANNTLSNNLVGIDLNYSAGTTVNGNSVTSITNGEGIASENNGGAGIGTADVISNNTVTGGDEGIFVFYPFKSVLVNNNRITNATTGTSVYGSQAAGAIPSFTGNIINGGNKPASTGALVSTYGQGFGNTNVKANYANNFVFNNVNGFAYESQAGQTLTVTANNNSITPNSNKNAIQTITAGTSSIDMTCNWWGSNNAQTVASTISGANIVYSPYLLNGTDNDADSSTGFQPAPLACNGTPVDLTVASITNVSCAGGSDGAIATTTTNGTSPYSYMIDAVPTNNTGNTTGNYTGLSAGNYVITVTDANGSMDTVHAAVGTVPDVTPPTAVCRPITVYLNNAGAVTIVADTLNNGSTDNCTLAANLTYSASRTSFNCADAAGTGQVSVTLTVTDQSNNSATCTSIVTVRDTTRPAIIAGTINSCYQTNAAAQAAAIAATTATDNCTTVTKTAATVGTCTAVVTVTATDASGNTNTVTYNTRIDNTPPVISTPAADTTTQCGPNNAAQYTAWLNNHGGAFATDACGAVTWTFACGNPPVTSNFSSPVNTVIPDNTPAGISNTITVTGLGMINSPSDLTVGLVVSNGHTWAGDVKVTLTSPGGNTIVFDRPGYPATSFGINRDLTGSYTFNPSAATILPQNDLGPVVIPNGAYKPSDASNPDVAHNWAGITFPFNANGNWTINVSDNASGDVGTLDSWNLSLVNSNCTPVSQCGSNGSTVVFTASDECGNPSTTTAKFIVVDTQAPVWTTTPNGIDSTINCNSPAALAAAEALAPVATDCSTITYTKTSTGAFVPNGTCPATGTYTNTFTATDACNNISSVFTQVITVQDTTRPVLTYTGPTTLNVGAFANCQTTLPDYTSFVTTQDCSSVTLVQQAPNAPGTLVIGYGGTRTIVIQGTDCKGNVGTVSFTLTIVDNTAPTAICRPVTLALNASGSATLTTAQADNGSNDGCSAVTLSLSRTAFSCADLGAGPGNLVTLTVTDASGNSSSCTSQVTVVDNIAPIITLCPGDTTIAKGANCTNIMPDLTFRVTATDNCTTITKTQSIPVGTIISASTTSVLQTITVTDGSNNSSTCTFRVFFADLTNPTITCAGPVTVNNTTGACSATVTLTTPTTADNCGVATVTNNHPSTTYPVGTTTVTWTVTDNAGNQATCTQTVTVTDNEVPSITCAGPVSVNNTPGSCNATVTLTAPTTADNCGVSTVTNDHPSTTYPVGNTTVTWTVTDIHNNTNTCTQVVTVTDNELPSITCAGPVSVNNTPGSCNATVTLTAPTTADNCGVSTVTNDHPSTTYPVGTTTVTWTVTDIHNNQNTCTQTVTVTDNQIPTITCGGPVSVNSAANSCSATVTLTPPTTGDNCGVASVVSNHPSTTYTTGTTTVTWTVTDIHGLTNTCTQNVTVTDNTPPVITTCAPAQSANTTAGACTAPMPDFTASVVASDNCTATNALIITQSPVAGTLVPRGSTSVTITVSDGTNTTTCITSFTVNDNQAPVFSSCPQQPITSNTNAANCTASIATPNPVFSDNCSGVVSLTYQLTGATGTVNGNGNLGTYLFPVGTTTVTYTATDGANNSSQCVYTVIVTNNLAGNISGTATVLQNSPSTPTITFSGSGGQTPYRFTYTVNNGGNQTVITSGTNTSTTVPQSNATLGQFIYTLVSIQDANGCFGTLPADFRDTITVVASLPRPDLSAVIPSPLSTTFVPTQTKNGYVQLMNNTPNPTVGPVTFRISKPTNFTLTIPTGVNNVGGVGVNNNQWTITDSGPFYSIVSTQAIAVPANSNIKIGFTLKAGNTANTSGLMNVIILDETGGGPGLGDSDNTNNKSLTVFSIN